MKKQKISGQHLIMAKLKAQPFFILEELFASDTPRSEKWAISRALPELNKAGRIETQVQVRNGEINKLMIMKPGYEPTDEDWASWKVETFPGSAIVEKRGNPPPRAA